MNIIELEPYLSPIEDEISEILLKDILKKEILHASMSKIMNSISRILSRIGATVAKKVLEGLDERIYEQEKETKRYRIKAKSKARNLVTSFGEISFNRRYYEDKQTRTYAALLDQILGIPAYARVETSCAAAMITNATKESYEQAAAHSTIAAVSGQTVSNCLKKMGHITGEELPYPERESSAKTIYIEADEDHISIANGQNREMKLAYVYEDKVEVSRNRRKTVGLRTFVGYEKAGRFWSRVAQYIYRTYDSDVKIYLIGDGGNWIKAGLDILDNCTYILDRFHLERYIRQIGKENIKVIKRIHHELREDDYETFKKEVEIQIRMHAERKEVIEKSYVYIKRNWEHAVNSMRYPEIKSSTEGHVSSILAARLTSRPMAWSEECSNTIGQLRGYAASGGNVRNYVEEILEKKSHAHTQAIQLRKNGMERKTRKCDLASGGNEYMLPGLESAKYRSLRNYLGNGFDHWN